MTNEERLDRLELLLRAVINCLQETDQWYQYVDDEEREAEKSFP